MIITSSNKSQEAGIIGQKLTFLEEASELCLVIWIWYDDPELSLSDPHVEKPLHNPLSSAPSLIIP